MKIEIDADMNEIVVDKYLYNEFFRILKEQMITGIYRGRFELTDKIKVSWKIKE